MIVADKLVQAPRTLALRTGRLRAEIAPEIGGALTRLAFCGDGATWFDVLRPASQAALAQRNVRETACFAMVPFASLVHRGHFRFAGQSVQLSPNMPGTDTVLHGVGWQRPWQITEAGPTSAELTHRQEGDCFAFRYQATLAFKLDDAELALTIGVRNTGSVPMPAGIGFHPFFSRSEEVLLQFRASARWLRDDHGRVIGRRPCGEDDSFDDPRPVGPGARNDVYDGWSGRARIAWPSAGIEAELSAAAPLSQLLIFAPPERPVLCIEPISNLPDAFNLLDAGAAHSGVRVLAPGEALSGTMRIAVRVRSATAV